jgi:hypothetical protein
MKRLISSSLCAVLAFYCCSFSQQGSVPAPVQAPEKATAAAGPGFSVDSIAIAGDVEQRMPVGVSSEFPWDVGRVSCWVRISSPQAPISLKFVWYKDDAVVLEWPYSLLMESGRVWSTKAVATGKWKVEIVDAARNVVKTATFEVKEHTM